MKFQHFKKHENELGVNGVTKRKNELKGKRFFKKRLGLTCLLLLISLVVICLTLRMLFLEIS
jgi:hypothetical protein